MRRVVALVALVLVACQGVSASVPPATPCDGEVDANGVCLPIVTLDACGPGTAALVGSRSCSLVGASDACAEGFRREASGWACEPVLPAAPCTGATIATLGSETCAPIDDCDAPFPPPDTTMIVDADHYKTINEALAVAPSGARIAIGAGTYPESLVLRQNVTLTGTCARDVILASGPDATTPGIDVASAFVEVRGITITGHHHGVDVGANTTLRLTQMLLDGVGEVGVGASGEQLSVTVDHVVVRDTKAADDGTLGRGFDLGKRAVVSIDHSEISGSPDAGILVRGAVVTMTSSVIARSTTRAVYLTAQSSLGISKSAITSAGEIGVHATGHDASVSIEDSMIEAGAGKGILCVAGAAATIHASAVRRSTGVALHASGATVDLDQTVLEETLAPPGGFGTGLLAERSATVTARATAIVESAGIAMIADASDLDLDHSAIVATHDDENGDLGVGAVARGSARLSLRTSTITDARYAGVVASDEASVVTLDHALVTGVRAQASDGAFGHGLVAIGAARADAVASVIRACDGSGFFYAASQGFLDRSLATGNAVGVHTQDGTAFISETDTLTAPAPGELRVTTDSRLDGNRTRTSEGALPIPDLSRAVR